MLRERCEDLQDFHDGQTKAADESCSTHSAKEGIVPRKGKAWQRALLMAIPSMSPAHPSAWRSDLSNSDSSASSSSPSFASTCSKESTTSDVTVLADPNEERSVPSTTWDELFDQVARTHTAQVRPRKLIRMRAEQLAEGFLMVWHGSVAHKEEAVRRFILATTGEESLRRYSFVVLRNLLEADGHLVPSEGSA